MTTINARINEAILRSKNLIRNPKNWIKGAEENEDYIDGEYVTQYCATGAINKIAGKLNLTNNELAEVKREIAAALDAKYDDNQSVYNANDAIISKNDDAATDHAEVIAAFDRALQRRREAARA